MGFVAFALFLLGLILVISISITKKKNKRCSAQTQGRWIAIVDQDNSNGTAPSVFVYSYDVNGVEYQIKSTAINKNVKNIGDACPIWYNPSNPKEATETHYESNQLYTIILIIGIVMMAASFVLPIVSIALQAMSK